LPCGFATLSFGSTTDCFPLFFNASGVDESGGAFEVHCLILLASPTLGAVFAITPAVAFPTAPAVDIALAPVAAFIPHGINAANGASSFSCFSFINSFNHHLAFLLVVVLFTFFGFFPMFLLFSLIFASASANK
jgi:hypothetical protein